MMDELYEKCIDCGDYFEPSEKILIVSETMYLCYNCILDLQEWAKQVYGEES